MSDSLIKVDIVSAESLIYSGDVLNLSATAIEGEICFFPRHTPYLAQIEPGQIRMETADKEKIVIYVSGGVIEVQPTRITVLADVAQRADDLDERQVLALKKQAEEDLKTKEGKIEFAQARAQLIQAAAQLKAIRKIKGLK